MNKVKNMLTSVTTKKETTYSFQEAMEASKEYFSGNELAAKVTIDKYFVRNENDELVEKTPDDIHRRLASEFARIDRDKYGLPYEKYFNLYYGALKQFSRLVAQGSPMAAIGNKYQTLSASNCVVIDSPQDSISGIMKTAAEFAQLFKRRCGVGTDLSELRPEGFRVKNAARTTSGLCSFADLYSEVTRKIGQAGRRGATMLTVSVHHPDVEKFARMKSDKSAVTAANVSVRITDEFMKAVESNSEYEQRWPCEGEPKFKRMVKAADVWSTIVEMATLHAEPGLIFWDNATERLPAESYAQFKSKCVNPCSEIILSPYDSCRLLSINLTGYVRNAFTEKSYFDYKSFESDAKLAMRMLDNLVDLELELIQDILKSCDSPEETSLWEKLSKAGEQGRRTGLGTHGLADTLAQLRIRYDSPEAIEWADNTYCTLRNSAYRASAYLAKERGPFPAFDWNLEKDNPFIKDLPSQIKEDMAAFGRRNISILTQAPTGTVSLVSKCGEFDRYSVSSGVEPSFRLSYIKRKKINRNDSHSRVDHVDEMGDRWQDYKVSCSNVQSFYEVSGVEAGANPLPDYFVTSDQINWQFRVDLQGTEQKYIDHCISSTVNLPKGTPPEVVGGIYMEAWKKKLKGITVYVDGSRMGVLLEEKPNKKIRRHEAPERPRDLPCDIHYHKVKGELWTALVGCLDGEPYELFGGYGTSVSLPQKYKKGFIRKRSRGKYDLHIPVGGSEFLIVRDIIRTFNDDEIGWTTRLVSVALIHGAKIDNLVTSLQKDGNLHSFNKVIARVLKKYIPDGQKVATSTQCPSCGSTDLVWQEGCVTCSACGYSKCS